MGQQVDKTKVISSKKVLKVFETFAGIGAQHKAIKNLEVKKKMKNVTFKVVGTSEWDARAIIAYAQIHKKRIFEKKLSEVKANWSEEQINKYLKSFTFSLDSKKPSKILSRKLILKQNLVAANIVNKNFPDITKLKFNEIPKCDLITYSFPCQGLSIANMGKDKGIDVNVKSTSNLIWQIRRLLDEAVNENLHLPKYLLMENVKNLLSSKHKDSYQEWLNYLESIGYYTNTILLNGINHNSLQKRERVFAISIYKPKIKLSDKQFRKTFFEKLNGKDLSIEEKKNKFLEILNSSENYHDEIRDATPNDTPSRKLMLQKNRILLDYHQEQTSLDFSNWTFNTLTTKQDRHPNIGMVRFKSPIEKGRLNGRFVTPREAYQIMGFESKDFDSVKLKYKEKILTKESLYRQAGNSIIVSVLEDVFKYISNIEVQNES